MKLNLTVENEGKIVLTDKEYLAAGGEAVVYCKDKIAYKIYHNASKMIPLPKIEELKKITPSNVLRPQNIIRDGNKAVGYTMRYIKSTHPLCKLFTMNFRQDNKIKDEDIVNLIKEMQSTVDQIHKDGCLLVDLNELNVLVSSNFETPFFIDVDSYQTPSYRATAIMESIRDRLVKNNQFTEMSDWFSFAIIAFQLYIGIHPYKGRHPDYKPNEWGKRMDDGISVFDKKVTIPKVCNDLSIIPKSHRDWFESLFVRNERSKPPLVDAIVTFVPAPDVFIEGMGDFATEVAISLKEKILSVFNFMGTDYVVGDKHLYKENKALPHDIDGCKVLFCESSDMSPIICKLKNDTLTFEDIGTHPIGTVKAGKMMYRNGSIYSVYDGKLNENTFDRIGNKILHKVRVASNVLELSTMVFDGVVFQDLLGKCYVTLPFEKGKCASMPVKELDGYRVLEARSEKNICGVLAEKKGVYCRFMLVFDDKFETYTVTRADDVSYSPINLTVMNNGLCIMAVDSDVHLFKSHQVKVINNPPFDADTRLSNASGKVFFIEKNKLYSVKMKK